MARTDQQPRIEKPASQTFVEAVQQIIAHAPNVVHGLTNMATPKINYKGADLNTCVEREDSTFHIQIHLGGRLLKIDVCSNERTKIVFEGKTFFINSNANEENTEEAQVFIEKYADLFQVLGKKYQEIAKARLKRQQATITQETTETHSAVSDLMRTPFEGTSVGIPMGLGANAQVADNQINALQV